MSLWERIFIINEPVQCMLPLDFDECIWRLSLGTQQLIWEALLSISCDGHESQSGHPILATGAQGTAM